MAEATCGNAGRPSNKRKDISSSSSSLGYGLNIRSSSGRRDPPPAAGVIARSASRRQDPPPSGPDPALLKFMDHMDQLPEDRGLDEFNEISVENFGVAFLSMYGWCPGQAVGRGHTFRPDVAADNLGRRHRAAYGLGYDPSSHGIVKQRDVWVANNNHGNDLTLLNDKKDSDLEIGEERRKRKKDIDWLMNHIRVRVIDRDFKNGTFYMKKGIVIDVLAPGICDLLMDESGDLVQGVEKEMLDLVEPEIGGPVLVICGEKKGVFGNLVEKKLEEGKAVVRDADDCSLLFVGLDEIAEFTGDASLLGY